MFKEFRKHYPQGSLVTEFVQVDREKYIVRALIQLNGITLLTSLAAANSVEEAEDKARERVLTLFDLDRLPKIEETIVHSNSNKSRTSGASLSAGDETSKMPVYSNKTPPEAIARPLATPEAKTNGKQIDLFNAPPLNQPIQPTPETEISQSLIGTLELAFLESVDPMDLIAKTDVELERLRWTKEQGRDFLLQHYGKRSRHVLNEKELLDFFNHLRSQ